MLEPRLWEEVSRRAAVGRVICRGDDLIHECIEGNRSKPREIGNFGLKLEVSE